jgi:hypothetical protein
MRYDIECRLRLGQGRVIALQIDTVRHGMLTLSLWLHRWPEVSASTSSSGDFPPSRGRGWEEGILMTSLAALHGVHTEHQRHADLRPPKC